MVLLLWNTALYCATSLDGGATFNLNQMTTLAASGKYLTYNIQEATTPPTWRWTATTSMWSGPRTTPGYYDSNEVPVYPPVRRSGPELRAPQKLAQNQTGGIANMQLGQETVAAKDGYVYVVFMTTDGTVYLRRSTDNGAGFFPLQNMGTGAWWPNMVVDPANGAKVHVFWWFTYRYSADGGATFTNPVALMPLAAQWQPSGIQMALGPGDSKHFVVSLYLFIPMPTLGIWISFTAVSARRPPPPGEGPENLHRHHGRSDCMEVASSD